MLNVLFMFEFSPLFVRSISDATALPCIFSYVLLDQVLKVKNSRTRFWNPLLSTRNIK